MPLVTIAFALGLIALGVGAWLSAGQTSLTALIPAFFGLPHGHAGPVAHRDSLRNHPMHPPP
ncbi:MAG: hypothetical protein MK142_10010, partial [Pseudomonadales bacterium]|nr:hypothetical protein [Pseudomonadales bacterium]